MVSRIQGVFVGMPRSYGEYESGILKSAVSEPVHVGKVNIAGDGQADLLHHGGGDRAVMMCGLGNYALFEQQLGIQIPHGGFGENLLVDNADEESVCLGDIWETDHFRLQVSQPRLPCFKLANRLDCKEIVQAVTVARRGGWYCRTLREGLVQEGDTLRLVERPHPEWTIARAFEVFLGKDEMVRTELGTLPSLSELWRERLPH